MDDRAPLRRPLTAWYRKHGRHDLPWRQTRDPYAVLVSEVMLQQTQVSRVIPYYHAWLRRWPDIDSLAEATPAGVIEAWSGLGYNRRALNLLGIARGAASSGGLASHPAALERLPGVGPYTARAVASFAGHQPVAVVDTNIARVLARHQLGLASPRDTARARLDSVAHQLLPREGRAARDHNLALMDLGALICVSRAPHCADCPIARSCRWLAAGHPGAHTTPQKAATPFEGTARFARGRIVEALRTTQSLDETALRELLPPAHRSRLAQYLDALAADGLLEPVETGWSLPGRQTNNIASPKL